MSIDIKSKLEIKGIVLINTGTVNFMLDKQVSNYSEFPPFGLMHLEAVLRMHGYRTTLTDLVANPVGRDEFIAKIREFDSAPLVVGISAYTENMFLVPQITGLIRRNFPKTKIIIGGPHVSFLPEEGFDAGADYVVRFEGEFTLIELLEHIKHADTHDPKSIKGIAYKDEKGRIVSTDRRDVLKNLDFLPFSEKFFSNGNKIFMLTSRGCPGTCIFCSSGAYYGQRYRQHSAERLVSMIYYASEKRGQSDRIEFLDDTFTINKKLLKKLFNLLRLSGINITWGARSRIDNLRESFISFMAENGCDALHFGVESVHQSILDSVQKKTSIKDFYENYSHFINHGILPRCSFIIGHHTDTLETIEETLMVALELELHELGKIGLSISTPFPGTILFDMAEHLGITISTYKWKNYTMFKPVYFTNKFQLSDIRKAYYTYQYDKRKVRKVGFLSGKGRPEFRASLMKWISGLNSIKKANLENERKLTT